MTFEPPKQLHWLVELAIIAAVYVIIFWVLVPLVFGIEINGAIPVIVAATIVGWFMTRRYRKNMEKRLGRKVKGDHELTSISSWMEAASKSEEPGASLAPPEIDPAVKRRDNGHL